MIKLNDVVSQTQHFTIGGMNFVRDPQTKNVLLVIVDANGQGNIWELDPKASDTLYAAFTEARSGVVLPDRKA